jgi:hypothetical protein
MRTSSCAQASSALARQRSGCHPVCAFSACLLGSCSPNVFRLVPSAEEVGRDGLC